MPLCVDHCELYKLGAPFCMPANDLASLRTIFGAIGANEVSSAPYQAAERPRYHSTKRIQVACCAVVQFALGGTSAPPLGKRMPQFVGIAPVMPVSCWKASHNSWRFFV